MSRDTWAARFFTIWTGQQLSLIGSRAASFSLVWWLTEATGSAQVLATATMALVVPQVLLGPVAGTFVDRWNRRLTILIADGGVALVALFLAYLFWTGAMRPWHVYPILLIRAIGGAFHAPAINASTTLLVPKRHLTRVAGLNQSMQGALNIVGPILGAFLISLLPVHGVMMIDVGTAAFAIVPLLFLSIPQPAAAGETRREPFFTSLRAGFRYVRARRGVLRLLGVAAAINFVVNPAFVLLPLLVTRHFGGGPLELGWLQSASGFGVIAGGLILTAWGGFRRKVVTALLGGALQGLALVLLGGSPSGLLYLAIGAMAVNGLCNAFFNGPLIALFQVAIPPEMQGRIFMVITSIAQGVWPISLAVAGPVGDLIGVRGWFVIGGALMSVLCLGALLVPSVVRLEDALPASDGETRPSEDRDRDMSGDDRPLDGA